MSVLFMCVGTSRYTGIRLISRVYLQTTKRSYCREKSVLNKVLLEYRDISLAPLHVPTTLFSKSFSQASLNIWPYITDENRNVIDPDEMKAFYDASIVDRKRVTRYKGYFLKFLPLFTEGMDIVHSILSPYCQEKKQEDMRHKYLRQAVNTLEDFLQNLEFHQECLYDLSVFGGVGYTETDITAMLANHLFKPLVSNDPKNLSYLITNDSEFKLLNCPCSVSSGRCDTTIYYGDTYFGSKHLWYGRPDLVLYPISGGVMGVSRTKKNVTFMKEANPDLTYKQLIEMICTEEQLRDMSSTSRFSAQAITFSMYQKQIQGVLEWKEKYPTTTLIPTIFVSPRHFDVYFYDAENDVFLMNAGKSIPIFQIGPDDVFTEKFNLNSIVQLWMMINHLLLQPSFSTNQLYILKDTCGVKRKVDSLNLRDKIEDSLNLGCLFEMPDRRIMECAPPAIEIAY